MNSIMISISFYYSKTSIEFRDKNKDRKMLECYICILVFEKV